MNGPPFVTLCPHCNKQLAHYSLSYSFKIMIDWMCIHCGELVFRDKMLELKMAMVMGRNDEIMIEDVL